MQIKEIDVLVHPDYSLSNDHLITAKRIALRASWTSRVVEAIEQREKVFLYYPAISTIPNTNPTRIQKYERHRKLAYETMLGERFFCLEGYPDDARLPTLLKVKGFTWDEQTKVHGFGEFYDACVDNWVKAVGRELNIPSSNLDRLPQLSLP